MYLSRKNPLVFNFFSWYVSYIIRKDFSGYSFNSVDFRKSQAILVLANHFSWWDGFLIFHLNKLLFKKNFHVLVTTDDYLKHPFYKYMGAFAPGKNGKEVLETLIYAGQLLDNPDNLVLIFPQGKIYTSYIADVNFEKGVLQLINASKKQFQMVFAATLVDYSTRDPKIQTFLTTWEAEEYVSLQLLKSEYNKHYEHSLRQQNSQI